MVHTAQNRKGARPRKKKKRGERFINKDEDRKGKNIWSRRGQSFKKKKWVAVDPLYKKTIQRSIAR